MRNDRKDQFYEPDLPPCDLPYLMAVLFDVGPIMAGGMASLPLDEQEIMAWQANTGILLDPWESRMIKRLSRDYLIESQKATDPKWPAPWAAVIPVEDKPSLAKRIRAFLRE